MREKTARRTAWELLLKTEQDGAFSNLALDAALTKANLEQRDKSFVSALYYGVLERKITLDFVVSSYSDRPVNKISIDILCVLRLGLYQLLYMNTVPDSAAVNESVKLTENIGKKSAKGFVNAVLRHFIRDGKKISYPDREQKNVSFLSVYYSCPEWLVKQWLNDYGLSRTEQILSASLGRPPVTLRVNTIKISSAKLLQKLTLEGASVKPHPLISECIIFLGGCSIEMLPSYREGFFFVQDIASQLCCKVLAPQNGESILDVCAAPGGKSFSCALMMNNMGKIISCDLYPKRTRLVEQGADRLGLSVIQTAVANAKEFHEAFTGADRVLCDVPCSGLGVIRRKPEIKYKAPEELKELPDIQYQILCNASIYVRSGGTLLYSTCSLSKQENEQVVLRFLNEHREFAAKPFSLPDSIAEGYETGIATLFPQPDGSDGFFIALLQKQKS